MFHREFGKDRNHDRNANLSADGTDKTDRQPRLIIRDIRLIRS
jgi:hypothetical protein